MHTKPKESGGELEDHERRGGEEAEESELEEVRAVITRSSSPAFSYWLVWSDSPPQRQEQQWPAQAQCRTQRQRQWRLRSSR